MNLLVVVSGDKSPYNIATKILEELLKNKKDKITVCVFDNSRMSGEDCNKPIFNFLRKKKIKPIDKNIKKYLSKIKKNQFDWLLNIWSPFIYKKAILNKFKNNLNLHPSYLPFSRGRDPYVWSIVNETPMGFTIHRMNDKIDGGKYYIRKKIKLKFPIVARDLFNLSLKGIRDTFIKNWTKIRNNKIKLKSFKERINLVNKRKDLITENFIDLDSPKNLNIRKFVLSCLGQDFEFLKLQLKMKNQIFNCKLKLSKAKKKLW